MLLADYLVISNTTSKQFAKRLGVSHSTVQKWRLKKKNYEYRIPKPSMVVKIERITKGAVTFSDWY